MSRLHSIIDVQPDLIMLLDGTGIILEVIHTLPDLAEEDVLGTSIFQYMNKDSAAKAARCLENVWATGQADSYEATCGAQGSEARFFETQITLFQENGERRGLLAQSRDNTSLHQALISLQTNSETLKMSQKLANMGSWDLEIESGTLSWTDQVFQIFGLSPTEFQATYEAFLAAIHPDDREIVNEAYNLAVKNKTPYDVVHRVLRPDGSVRVVRETSEDIMDSAGNVVRSMGIVHDITEQHSVQKEQERFLSTLLANIPGMVYRCQNTPEWDMEYLSQGCFDLTGYHPAELMNSAKRTFNSLIHPEDVEQVWAVIQEALNKKTFFELAYRIRTADGKDRWLWERGRGIYSEQGELQALEGFASDYTTIKNEQQSRLDLERKVMNNQKFESLGLMAGGIAHDFNNLLMIIMGNVELALHDLSPQSPTLQYLENIGAASRRAADLAQQMLAYSGKGKFVVSDICINTLLTEMTQMMEISISRTGNLELILTDDIPEFVGDITQIRQIAMNLVSNAAEAMEDRHGTIRVTSGAMWCNREYIDRTCATHLMMYDEPISEGQYVYFEVSDTGSGMAQAILDRIFDPFFTTKFTGRGLGLAATLGIIRGHHGTLLLLSEPGQGTSFRVLFPTSELTGHTESASDPKFTDDALPRKGLVLLADDEEMLRDLGRSMLQHLGFSVITAADGMLAVQEFEKHVNEISLVMLDLTMPNMNGEEAFQKITAIRPGIKVILCTGFTENETNRGFKDDGFAGYLHKPFTFNALHEEIRKVLD
ncbi:MAG: PAS domain-containing protein [Gemmatimonadales bacterium]|nr:PAS domain-containing protein [Gemmatimonadales bacterium]